MTPLDLRQVNTREAAVNLLGGASEFAKAGLNERVNRRPLVKTYMLEHDSKPEFLSRDLLRLGVVLEPLGKERSFFKVRQSGDSSYIGFIESLTDRHPVLYTTETAASADRWVRTLVARNPAFDRLWISGAMFRQLWAHVQRTTSPHRFGRMVFQHENPFDTGEVPVGAEEADDEEPVLERKATRFTVVERISELTRILPEMRDIYKPLYSIAQLRIPGDTSGGHDLYFDGKVTNRTASFLEHRLRVQYVLNVYQRATAQTEKATWTGMRKVKVGNETRPGWELGAPVELQFGERLRPDVFDRFVDSVFVQHHSAFKLWGNPIRLGPTKVHVYAVDRHVAKQLFLEITERGILAVVPEGTCGNSIHRLVTNVQQYLDPAVRVWVGDRTYEETIETDPNELN